MKYYLLVVEGGVEIHVEGPFLNRDKRLTRARELNKQFREADLSNTFGLDIDKAGKPSVWAYTQSTIEGTDE